MKNILFLCTGNSCRSILAEGLMRHYGKGKFVAFSAGSEPAGFIHPLSLQTLKDKGINTKGFYSKSWNELEGKKIDIIITVCDNAAGESCPVFLSGAIKAHWGMADPAKFVGTNSKTAQFFKKVCAQLEQKIKALVSLDVNHLSNQALKIKLEAIANEK